MFQITHVKGFPPEKKGADGLRAARRIASLAFGLALGLFFLPALLSGLPLVPAAEPEPEPEATLPFLRAQESAPDLAAGRWDKGRAVRLARADGTVEELTMDQYLWGVVAAEMPASFPLEALKAQAVAGRTYTAEKQAAAGKHPDADLCDQSTCCQAYLDREAAAQRWGLNAGLYADKVTQAVAETDGLGILYQNQPIQALFFSSAAGHTADAVAVWGNTVDYLVGVDSPEGDEVPNYRSQVLLTPQEASQAVLAAFPEADLSGPPEGWLGPVSHSAGGRVTQLVFGGATLTGDQARSVFALRSANFQAQWDGAQFVFDVTGYGHGVGMSQYGASAMARNGADFREILTWYYTGTQVEFLWDGT